MRWQGLGYTILTRPSHPTPIPVPPVHQPRPILGPEGRKRTGISVAQTAFYSTHRNSRGNRSRHSTWAWALPRRRIVCESGKKGRIVGRNIVHKLEDRSGYAGKWHALLRTLLDDRFTLSVEGPVDGRPYRRKKYCHCFILAVSAGTSRT